MRTSDKIYQEVKKLPEPLQLEVLHFVQYLATKADLSFSNFSLSSAMRGMEDEHIPTYSTDDLKEVF
jgi:hypothetical protein